MPPPNVTIAKVTGDPETYEDDNVHSVYEQIASHFSSTRYKPWPIIAQFLSSIPVGSVGLDSGTGNGKYLPLSSDGSPGSIWTIGLDRSRNLLEIARTAGGTAREVVLGDVLGAGWRDGAFDYAISIATIHHLATPDRRKEAIQRLIQCVRPSGGRILIYVWAVEQDTLSKRDIPDDGQQVSTGGSGRDVFVPWVLSSKTSVDSEPPQTFHRYYHMFDRGELRKLVISAAEELRLKIASETDKVAEDDREGIEIVQDGWERSNYYVEIRRWCTNRDRPIVSCA